MSLLKVKLPFTHFRRRRQDKPVSQPIPGTNKNATHKELHQNEANQTYSETYSGIPGDGYLTPMELQSQTNVADVDRNYDGDQDVYTEVL